jgi:hypothetical protein
LQIGKNIIKSTTHTAQILTAVVCDRVLLSADPANTDIAWLGLTSTVESGTGYPLAAGEILDLHYNLSQEIYATSEGGSAVVHFMALKKVVE